MDIIAFYDGSNNEKPIFEYCKNKNWPSFQTIGTFQKYLPYCSLFVFHDSGTRLYHEHEYRISAIVNQKPNEFQQYFGTLPKDKSVILEVTDGGGEGTIKKVNMDDNHCFFYAFIPRVSSLNTEEEIKSLIDSLTFEDNTTQKKAIEIFYDSTHEERPIALINPSDEMKNHLRVLEDIFKPAVCLPRLWVIGKVAKVAHLEVIDNKELDSIFNDCELTFREKNKLEEDAEISEAKEKCNPLDKYKRILSQPDLKTLLELSSSRNIKAEDIVNILSSDRNKEIMLIIFSSDVKLGSWAFEKLEKGGAKMKSMYMLVSPQGVIRSDWPGWQRESQSIQVIQKIKKTEGITVVPLDLDYECSIFFDVKDGKESVLLPQWKELLGSDKCLPALQLDSLRLNCQQQNALGAEIHEAPEISQRFINTMITIGH